MLLNIILIIINKPQMKSDIADCAIDDYGTYKYIQILIKYLSITYNVFSMFQHFLCSLSFIRKTRCAGSHRPVFHWKAVRSRRNSRRSER